MNKAKYILLFSTILILSSKSFAQDSSFIDSLPDNIKKDFEDQMISSEEQSEDNLRSYDSSIKKTKELIKKLEKDLKKVKNRIAPEEYKDKYKLERFGENYFNSLQTSFMPINEPGISSEYILTINDKVELYITGTNQETIKTKINKDGSIFIPQIGKVNLAGLTIDYAQNLLTQLINDSSIGGKIFLTLKEISDIQILVAGNVENPGIYTLPSNTNVLHAINVTGGINTEGSFRNISLKRNNKILENIDLYDLFVDGLTPDLNQLRSGDVIFIGSPYGQVSISGGINIDAIYEIKQDDSLEDLIRYAGGISNDFYGTTLILNRKNQSDDISLDVTKIPSFSIMPGDKFYLPSFEVENKKISTVIISGHVKNPGTYNFVSGDKLSDIIKKSGGFKSNAYPLAGIFTRDEIKEKERVFNQKIYKDMIRYLVTAMTSPSSRNVDMQNIAILLSEFKDVNPIGRLSVEFDLGKISLDDSLDTELMDGDKIHVPAFVPEVFVFGEVYNTRSAKYFSKYTVYDYIDEAGGLTELANDSIIVVGPDGKTTTYKSASLTFMENFSDSQGEILPGSSIYIPRKINTNIENISLIAPIFSSLALSLASISVLND